MEHVEEKAGATLAQLPVWVWDGEALPIPIDEIAETWFSLRVREVEDMSRAPGCPTLGDDESLSGLLIPSLGEIWVNAWEAREWPGRRRFTIAHELGHWVLHRTGQQPLFCRKSTVAPEEARGQAKPATTKPPVPITEEEANVFAAALLMPAGLIEHHYYATERSFERLCELFGSSGAAMGRRLRAVI